jgi:hypothetical protein
MLVSAPAAATRIATFGEWWPALVAELWVHVQETDDATDDE